MPIFRPGTISQLMYEALGGQNSPIREATIAQLGHPALPSESIYLPDDLKEYDDQVWLHEVTGDYPLPDDADSDREDSAPAVFTGYLAPEKLLSGRRKFGATVRVKWVNGRYEVEGVAGPAGENYLGGAPEIDYIVIRRNQLDWGLLRPTEPPSARVILSGGVFRDGTTWYANPDRISSDLITTYGSALTPGQGVAVQIEMAVSTGTITYTAGSAFTDSSRDSETGAVDHSLVFANYPVGTSNALRHFGWVKLYYQMQVITEQDILVAPDESAGGAGALVESDLPSVAFANKFGAKFTSGVAASRPATAAGVGDAYLETDTGLLNICLTGTTWTQYSLFDLIAGSEGYLLHNGSNAMTGDLDFASNPALMTERGAKPSTPATGKWKVYTKADGLYVVDDAGTETGPMGTGSGGATLVYTRAEGDAALTSLTSSQQFFNLNFTDDPSGFVDGLNADRCDIPAGKGGRYMVKATVDFYEAADTGTGTGYNQVIIDIQKNGITGIGNSIGFLDASSTESNEVDVEFDDLINLLDTDYIRVGVRRLTGSDTLDAILRNLYLVQVA